MVPSDSFPVNILAALDSLSELGRAIQIKNKSNPAFCFEYSVDRMLKAGKGSLSKKSTKKKPAKK